MRTEKVYQVIANKLNASLMLAKNNIQNEWSEKHPEDIEKIVNEYMPSGSGFNTGTNFSFEKSNPEKLIFESEYEYMNNNGMYAGSIPFTVTVKPSLIGEIDVTVSGRFSKLPTYLGEDLKDCIVETFNNCLNKEIDW